MDDDDTIWIDHRHTEKGSGLTVSFNGTRGDYIGSLKHELAHFTIATGGHHTYSAVNFGLGRDSYSPYDMILSGYMQPKIFNFNTQIDFTLGDFSSRNNDTIGNILKVPISGEEYFLISSRRKVSRWDRVISGDTILKLGTFSDNTEYGKGVYIYHIKNGIFHPGGDISPQDMECADGYWQWSDSPSGHHYQTVPTTCYQSPPGWPYFNKLNPLYTNDESIIENPISVGDGQSFYHSYCYNDTTCGAWVKWWGFGEKEANSCLVGKDRRITNKNEIYSSLEAFGDRWDAWNVGYNEVFSPYSSPSTKSWNNSETGIFIWHYSQNGNDAKFEIYKASEYGGTTSLAAILEATPPSRPMGIVVDYHLEGENIMRPIITWNHNKEPDMLRTDLKKRYKIWRATQTNMNYVPTSYTLLKTLDIDSGTAPSYIDTSIIGWGSAWPGMGEQTEYPVRYSVQAIDTNNDASVQSDFGSAIGLKNCWPCSEGARIEPGEIPETYNLYENYPNPFNPETKIKFDLPIDNNVTIKVYNILGKEIYTLVNDFKQAGRYLISFNGSNLSSGIYYYRIKAGEFEQVRKMILMK